MVDDVTVTDPYPLSFLTATLFTSSPPQILSSVQDLVSEHGVLTDNHLLVERRRTDILIQYWFPKDRKPHLLLNFLKELANYIRVYAYLLRQCHKKIRTV